MFAGSRIDIRHSEGSAGDERQIFTLRQEQMMYKVKMADKSMVCDGHDTQAINSKPVYPTFPGQEDHQVVMHQPDWLKISRSNSLKNRPALSLPPDSFAEMAAKSIGSISEFRSASGEETEAMTGSYPLGSQPGVLKKFSKKKSVPRHRCNTLNRSLTSLMRPSNYLFQQVEERRYKSLPPNSFELDANAFKSELTNDEGFDNVIDDNARLRNPLASIEDTPWIPKGVEFDVTVEAYVYHNHDVCFPASKSVQGNEYIESPMN